MLEQGKFHNATDIITDVHIDLTLSRTCVLAVHSLRCVPTLNMPSYKVKNGLLENEDDDTDDQNNDADDDDDEDDDYDDDYDDDVQTLTPMKMMPTSMMKLVMVMKMMQTLMPMKIVK
ncbi:hypothetical protein ElyMa_002173100 [Elysia marginata]|uniref:Uncharacterized protein n=1 Tax=Elysia marginata TaxID=1093978 RepID=A0AAV4FPG0_9GAST|nr:hypothetical protein ElyMa_002173100 [Elysia marginata]